MENNKVSKQQEPECISIPVNTGVMPGWMDEARQLAAQCWCDKETENKVMDPELAEAVAKRIAAWIATAAQNQRNADYYRGVYLTMPQGKKLIM